jgi:GntR family transcriptional regulator/MocR family aminotransferase
LRSAHDVTGLWVRLFPRFARSATTLQGQVKALMVHSILSGMVRADARVPPRRSLALALGISRNTVALALQTLVDKGFVVARSRSGLCVNRAILAGQVSVGVGVGVGEGEGDGGGSAGASVERRPPDLHWTTRLKSRLREQRNVDKPANWQEFRYPFIYGQFDASLMPLKDWRACTRQSLLAPAVKHGSQDFMDRDSEVLLEQIQHRLLPARGIFAAREEILVTAGAQMACHLLAQVLVSRSTVVGIEDPAFPDAHNKFTLRSANVRLLPVDAQGRHP